MCVFVLEISYEIEDEMSHVSLAFGLKSDERMCDDSIG